MAVRHRHVVEVVEDPLASSGQGPIENKPAEMLVPEVQPPALDTGLLGLDIEESSGGGIGWWWWVVGALVLAGLVTGGWLVWRINRDRQQIMVEGEPSPTPQVQVENLTPSPVASPTAEVRVDLTKIKMQILNGSGIKGEAGKVAELLKKAGFVKIVTGNAKKFNYEDILIDYKKDLTLVQGVVKKALEEQGYKVTQSEGLKDSGKFDVEIIVGKK